MVRKQPVKRPTVARVNTPRPQGTSRAHMATDTSNTSIATTTTATSTVVENVPDDVLATLLLYLDLRFRVETAAVVCKRFNACVRSTLGWNGIDLSDVFTDEQDYSADRVTKLLKQICRRVSPQSITESLCCVVSQGSWSAATDHRERRGRRSRIPATAGHDFFRLLASFTSLKRLNLTVPAHSHFNPNYGAEFMSAIAGMRDLRDLSLAIRTGASERKGIQWGSPALPLRAWPHLQHLRLIEHVWFGDRYSRARALTVPSSLNSLEIDLHSASMYSQVDFTHATNLTTLRFSAPATMVGLRSLTNLQKLTLGRGKIGQAYDMRFLGSLREVSLHHGCDASAIIRQLSFMHHCMVASVHLNECKLSADDMTSLSRLPLLNTLELYNCTVNPSQAYESLASLTSLTSLKARFELPTKEFLECIGQIPSPTDLDLEVEGLWIEDEDEEYIGDLPDLITPCTTLRSLKYYSFDLLSAFEGDAFGQKYPGLESLTIHAPESYPAFCSLQRLLHLTRLEVCFEGVQYPNSYTPEWFGCLQALPRLHTLVIRFEANSQWRPKTIVPPPWMVDIPQYLRGVRELSHVELCVAWDGRCYRSPVSGEDVGPVPSFAKGYHHVVAAFSCLGDIKLVVCGDTYDLSNSTVRRVLEREFDEWKRKEAAKEAAAKAEAEARRQRKRRNGQDDDESDEEEERCCRCLRRKFCVCV